MNRLAAAKVGSVTDSFVDDGDDLRMGQDPFGTARRSPLLPGVFCAAADLHNHTRFSDGRGQAAEAFASLRSNGLDVAALTDHANFASGVGRPGGVPLAGWLNGIDGEAWKQTAELADLADDPGRFVAIRGFEWSHPLLGHVNVWGSPDFLAPTPSHDMRHLYDWLEGPGADDSLASFNHPGSRGTVLRFGGFSHRQALTRRLVGLEMFNKRDDYLFAGVDDGARSPLVECLSRGWRPGLIGVTDEHGKDWGRPEGKGRTGLFVRELTRDGVREALLARRTFATRLRGLRLAAVLTGADGVPVPMGGDVTALPGRRSYSVTVDLDLGPGAVGLGLSVQLLRPGAVVPQVTEVARVVSGDAPTTVDIDVDPQDGAWAVLRVSDLAGEVDPRAPAPYRHLGSSVAYTSPWWFIGT
ncbi:MAG: hypothetical protein QOJ32_166 [Frankiaceae bacterium]|nr:hypothetical protein [Frankiaceae bacterium]MDQ1650203.1 hypothetical protein [Frankiaceae bacterium]